MNVCEIKNLTKYYGSFKALDAINLTVKQGEILGFIGPNGAGKTTTIRILLGLLKGNAGSATIFGMNAWEDAVEIHKRIAYVPGDVHLWPNLTGGEVIDYFVRLSGSVDKEKIASLIKRFDLDPTKKCRTYSKGNKQKVGLIAAFATDAEFIILDEPTSGLDPLMVSVFQDCVLEAKAAGKTVLMSSHILADVERLCDRVSIIRHGRIVETGTLDEMRHMTRITMRVKTTKTIDPSTLTHAHDVIQEGDETRFQIEPDHIDNVLKTLMEYHITHITSTPPSLEEIFMRHYGDDLASINGKGD